MGLIFIVAAFVVLLLSIESHSKESLEEFKEIHTKHNWSYNKDNKLECIECSYIAGSDFTSRGDE